MCIVCDRIQRIKEGKNPYFIAELKTGYVVLGDYQHFKGYTLFLYKEHVTELFELDENAKKLYMEEMITVAKAVSKAFKAEKMNYECLGNGDAHLHWHLFPRYEGDLDGYGNSGKGPVGWYPREKMYSDDNRPSEDDIIFMREKIRYELERV